MARLPHNRAGRAQQGAPSAPRPSISEVSPVSDVDQFEGIPIRIQGKSLRITQALRSHIQQKLSKLPRYLDQIQDAQVVLSVSRDRSQGRGQIAEMTVWCDGLVLRSQESSDDMYTSIDRAAEKLERQIEKFRSRMIEKRRRDEARRRLRRRESAAATAGEVGEARFAAGSQAAPRIARRKRFPMKPMSLEEAAIQMDLLGHSFFVFRRDPGEEINVLYRRQDGDLGLIEPEG